MGVAFKKGDRVYVTDPGLAMLRKVMQQAGQPERPNHHGTVAEVYAGADDMVLIDFDEDGVEGAGNAAPYPIAEVRHIVTKEERGN